MYLTKSDFKVARTCPTKLYYKKLRYPSLMEDNPFLEFLADGGYMVEAMAKLLYPGGKEIGLWDRPLEACDATKKALSAGDCVLFEATVVDGLLLARTDILERRDGTLSLVEVKSSSFDSEADGQPFRGKRGGIASKWKPYLEDVAFQAVVLERAFPGFKVHPWLCIIDKSKTATPNCTFDRFKLVKVEERDGAWRPTVNYTGNPARLLKENLVTFEDVSTVVCELRTEVGSVADEIARTLANSSPARIPPELGYQCKKCEYRLNLSGEGPSGFRDCWGDLACADPHVLDLYRVDLAGGKGRDIVAEMAAIGQSALADVPLEALRGTVASRQEIQLTCTAAGGEYVSESLPGLLAGHPYPLHFIDFEASRCALPYHEGMHPYELAAFQWSCHTIRAPGAPLEHSEWLNDQEAFPNFEFARSLRGHIGEEGTVYMWHHFERSVLKAIREQMDRYGESDAGLAGWLDRLTAEGNSRLVDMCALAKEHYFHPMMKGSLSIKHVLPAVWEADPALRARPEFRGYARTENGRLLNPYETLEALPFGDGEESVDAVQEGTAAVRTYQEMMFGPAVDDPARRKTYRKLLLQYCGLDTAAMVIIWMHWKEHGASTY